MVVLVVCFPKVCSSRLDVWIESSTCPDATPVGEDAASETFGLSLFNFLAAIEAQAELGVEGIGVAFVELVLLPVAFDACPGVVVGTLLNFTGGFDGRLGALVKPPGVLFVVLPFLPLLRTLSFFADAIYIFLILLPGIFNVDPPLHYR